MPDAQRTEHNCFIYRKGKRGQNVVGPRNHLSLPSLVSTEKPLHEDISALIDTISIAISFCPQVKGCDLKKTVTDFINSCFL